jgi:hypothetical protein
VILRFAPFYPHVWRIIINDSSTGPDTTGNYFSSRLAAFHALENWKNGWKAAELGTYLSAYSKDFIPSGDMSLATWRKNRTENLTQPQYIRIELVNPIIEMLEQTRVMITFKQIYETETYRDIVIKTLTMKREGEQWRIIKEQVIETLAQ